MARTGASEARPGAQPLPAFAALLSRPGAAVAFGLAYFACAEIGHALTLGDQRFATFWPAAGLYLSVLASIAPRRWLPFVAAAAVTNLFSDVALHAKPVAVSAAFVLANTLEAAVAAFILQRHSGAPVRLEGVRDALRLVLVTVLIGAGLAASIGAITVHTAFGTSLADVWLTWWSADALGTLLVAPALLAWTSHRNERQSDHDVFAHVLGIAATLSLATAIFLRVGTPPVPYVFLPPLLWAAARFGIAGGAAAMLCLAFGIVGATSRGIGPYAGLGLEAEPFLLQMLLATYAFVALVVAAQFVERRRFERALLDANENLEQRVAARTERLRASEKRYRHLVDLAPDPIFVNRNERIVLANQAFLALVGASDPRQVLERSPLDFIRPTLHAQIRGRIQWLLATGESQPPMEQTWVRLDGEEIEVEVSAALHEDPEGNGVQVLLRDITERRRVQRALAENEERLRLALHAARMFAFEWNPATDTVVRSAECEALIGMPGGVPDTGKNFFARIDAADRERLGETIGALAPGHEAYQLVYRLHKPDGALAVLEESAEALFDETGQLARLVGITVDVTEREAALAQLRESENRFATLAYALPAVLFTADAAGRWGYVNPAFTHVTGLELDALRADAWTQVLHGEDVRRVRDAWTRSLATGEPFSMEYRLRQHDGTSRWFKGYSTPVRDADGRILKWIGVALDIHELRQAQAALVAADRRKDEFLAMLAHELRNPLAPIRNAVAILTALAPAEPALRRAVDIIGRQSAHLARLVDDLLDVARVTRGKITLTPEPIALDEAVQAGIELARPALDAKEQRVEVSLPTPALTLHVDPTRFAQVIGNLLQNASKFSPPRQVVRIVAAVEDEGVAIRVIDRGAGIPAEMLPHVFDLFTQGDRSLDRAQGGLGIGLALVKSIVELHGGRVIAASDCGGSEFVVWLPLASRESVPAPECQPALASYAQGPARHVLVVEDNADAAQSLIALLKLQGHTVAAANNGVDAIELAAEFRPDVVILDIGLPGMDGYTLARMLRESAQTRDCLLIALTGYGQPEDRARALAAGFDTHLVKPVEFATLARILAAGEPRQQAAAA